jgi:hypothetical protein
MKSTYLILAVAMVSIVVGCTSMPKQDICGMWTASFGDSTMLIQLEKNEHWQWWAMREAPPPKPPSQEGRWFIHDGIIVLRVEKTESDKLPAGLAFTFDVRNVSADRLTLYNLQMEKEEYWERTANK